MGRKIKLEKHEDVKKALLVQAKYFYILFLFLMFFDRRKY
jgi:hypothetical protein